MFVDNRIDALDWRLSSKNVLTCENFLVSTSISDAQVSILYKKKKKQKILKKI